jgi:hypothetical protein
MTNRYGHTYQFKELEGAMKIIGKDNILRFKPIRLSTVKVNRAMAAHILFGIFKPYGLKPFSRKVFPLPSLDVAILVEGKTKQQKDKKGGLLYG